MTQIPVDKLVNPSGKVYYRAVFDVVLSFGLIEMTAQIAWHEKVCHVLFITDELPKFSWVNALES